VFKRVLKSVFPILLLKRLFLLYNGIRVVTIDRLLFPEFRVAKSDFHLYRVGYPFRENEIEIGDIEDGVVRGYMRKWFYWTQEEFILKLQRACLIEPDYGWAIVGRRRLLYFSLGISRTPFLRKPRIFPLLFLRRVEHLEGAISLRDTGEENYFHFYNDVLTKIFLLRENNVKIEDYPLIISKKLWEKDYFQFYLNKSRLFQNLKWVIQDRQYIEVKSSWFCKAITHSPVFLKGAFPPFPVATTSPDKIFVTRNRSRLRHLDNDIEVEGLFSSYGFLVIDSDTLSIEYQIQIFSNASFIAGVHGAGLTNIGFCNGPCKVLEIFPYPVDGYLPFHYIMLTKMKRGKYQAVIGEKSVNPFQTGFSVDLNKIRRAIECML